ncbi:MAG: hypothetical protein ABI443_03130 [Chthoniobacterales bacterium]
MKTLRSIHLYLGCTFAPMVVFFAISGLWQTFHFQSSKGDGIAAFLAKLSTIHTSKGVNHVGVATWSSLPMKYFVIAATLSLLFTIVLGVVLAFKYGRGRVAALCLTGGILIPAVLVLLSVYGAR